MRYLVFGGEGFIGRNFCSLLNDLGHEYFSCDLINGYDITEKDSVQRAFECKPDIVVNFAFQSIVSKAANSIDETFKLGLIGNGNVQYFVSQLQIQKYVYVSSSMVYGDFEGECDESFELRPKNWYGVVKTMVEKQICSKSVRYPKVPYSIVRPTAVYGPDDNHKRVVSLFVDKIKNNEEIIIKNDGKFNFTHVKDCVMGIYLASQHEKNDIFNICYPKAYSLFELVNTIELVFRKNIELKYEKDEQAVRRGILSCKKAIDVLGFRPKYSLLDGVRTYDSSM